MKNQSLAEKIESIEKNFRVQDILIEYKGEQFDVYPWIKPYIFSQIQLGSKVDRSKSKSKFFQLKKLLIGIFKLNRNHKTIVFSNSLENRVLEGVVYDKLFGKIIEKSTSVLRIETFLPINDTGNAPPQNSQLASRGIFYLKQALKKRLSKPKFRILNEGILQEVLDELSISVNYHGIFESVLCEYEVMDRYLRKRKSLKQVFLSVGYVNVGLILACKKNKITVIEAQHGVINKDHYGYSYFYQPSGTFLPDFLLTFGLDGAEVIESSGISSFVKVVPVGSFIIDYYLNRKIQENENMTVSISLQDCDTGLKATEQFLELARKNDSVTFIFKPRRTEVSFYQEKFKIPNNVIFETEKNVYEVILSSNFHMTAYSSCALEAPSLGVRNILLNTDNKAQVYYGKTLSKSGTFFCENIDEIEKVIFDSEEYKSSEIKDANRRNIMPYYETNIDAFLESLSNEH